VINDTATVVSTNNVLPSLSASASIALLSPDVSVTKVADSTAILVGQSAGYQITVTNLGLGTALGFALADLLPAGVSWTVVSGPGVINGLLLTTPGVTSLNAGTSFSIRVTGTALAQGSLANVVTVSASNELTDVVANNTATATILVTEIITPVIPVTVASVIRLGIHNQVTRYVISFSGALNPIEAANLVHYELVQVNSRNRVIGSPIVLTTANYDPSAGTVTLVARRRLNVHNHYRLTITGLSAASGEPIVGSSGLAGSPFVAYLGRESLRIPTTTSSTVPVPHSISTAKLAVRSASGARNRSLVRV
jgi:uncharacterized repeat protein (TIGR01451 family)